ncbi:glutathione binding-like protein [Bacteriovorax sp. Seq25_V]|uniref:glutathione binding-like protein n=1 Tax=Bacteriovorax sp. Seq25_V TaxID=1201288 RepID=UPI000389ECEE|nr:glutathione binding-like protein [Bacteriovorax sp. Seq25_V]EQC45706.1 glutathione S-transferase, N-terminal domain protein [Bacteriovorax sp. Seq25_V]
MNEIKLYSLATPNGQKISVALEEMGLTYQAYTINILNGDQFTPEFVAINPNSKIPAIVDTNGHQVFESGAILLYLAEKTGLFLSSDPILRSETLQWLFFQMGGVGPMFGQFGHFYKYAGEKCTHPYPVERYTNETKRLLGVVDKRLEGRTFLVGEEYSIADMAIFPWVLCLDKFYNASEYLGLNDFKNIKGWLERILSRDATQRGLTVCSIS